MLKIDLHIHTLQSGHAYPSYYEVLEYAKQKGMEMIAVTEHGPSMEGSVPEVHFSPGLVKRSPKQHGKVNLLWGCEANIINEKGDLDIQKRYIDNLDVVLAALHVYNAFSSLGKEKNTQAVINAFRKNRIHIFAHPFNLSAEFDYDKVYREACKRDILLELNLAYLKKLGEKSSDEQALHSMIEIVKSNKKKLIVNSDAHFLHEIGDDSILNSMKDKLGLTDDMIINNYPAELKTFLASK